MNFRSVKLVVTTASNEQIVALLSILDMGRQVKSEELKAK